MEVTTCTVFVTPLARRKSMYCAQAFHSDFSVFLSQFEVWGRRASSAGKSSLAAGTIATRLLVEHSVVGLPWAVIFEPFTALGQEAQAEAIGSAMLASGVMPSTDEQRGGLFSPATYWPS